MDVWKTLRCDRGGQGWAGVGRGEAVWALFAFCDLFYFFLFSVFPATIRPWSSIYVLGTIGH